MCGRVGRRKFLILSGISLSSDALEKTIRPRRPQSEWPMDRYDAAGTGYRPSFDGPKAEPTIRWKHGYDARITPAPVTVSGGRVYHVNRDRITVRETQTGKKRFAFTGGPYLSSISIADGSQGRNGVAAVANEDGLLGLDPRGGVSVFGFFHLFARRWAYPKGLDLFENGVGPAQTSLPPVIAGNRLYFAETRTDQSLIALDTPTGDRKWTIEFRTDPTRPAVSNSRVFVGVWDNGVVAVDSETGERRWHRSTDESDVFGPAVADGVVYVTDERNVYAFDADEGSTIWRHRFESRVRTPPVVTTDSVYVATEEHLVSFERSGNQRWRLAGGCRDAALSAAAETIYQPMGETLRAVDASGRVRWSFEADSEIATPVLGDETVYLSSSRSLYAIE